MKTDSLFYRLFQEWPGLVLELAELELPAAGYTLRAEEVKRDWFSAGRCAGAAGRSTRVAADLR
ncbi:MAG: Rpn family recombination-promoting nuclease/putative transposase [Comamonadaceae bacterium]|nr:Rpn family recombination-promoting nuclease/putative transposase [Comamonadaceae bacterium]